MRGIRHTAGSGSKRLPPDAEFPKPVPDKPFEPGDHRASWRVFPHPALMFAVKPLLHSKGTGDAGD